MSILNDMIVVHDGRLLVAGQDGEFQTLVDPSRPKVRNGLKKLGWCPPDEVVWTDSQWNELRNILFDMEINDADWIVREARKRIAENQLNKKSG